MARKIRYVCCYLFTWAIFVFYWVLFVLINKRGPICIIISALYSCCCTRQTNSMVIDNNCIDHIVQRCNNYLISMSIIKMVVVQLDVQNANYRGHLVYFCWRTQCSWSLVYHHNLWHVNITIISLLLGETLMSLIFFIYFFGEIYNKDCSQINISSV